MYPVGPEQVQAFLALLNSIVEIYKAHELLVVAASSGIAGVHLGVWIYAIRNRNVADDAQRQHEKDQAALKQVGAANAYLTQVIISLMKGWNSSLQDRCVIKSRDYVAKLSEREIMRDFPIRLESRSESHPRKKKRPLSKRG